jgi:DMSO reductase family type II enzyme chaperone
MNQDMQPAAENAAIHSALYALFAEAFAYPRGELLDAIRSGDVAQRLQSWVDRLGPALTRGVDWAALADAGDRDEALPAEFTRLFDPGTSAPPCSLHGGLHVGPQMITMEEVLRFYHHFGLAPAADSRETPDHLSSELEFLHVLAFGEADLCSRGEDPTSYRLGRRDFIARHPGRWIPLMRAKLGQQNPLPYYAQLVELLERCLAADLGQLEARHGMASLDPHRSVSA